MKGDTTSSAARLKRKAIQHSEKVKPQSMQWVVQGPDPQTDPSRTCPIGDAVSRTDAEPVCLANGTLSIPGDAASPAEAPEAQADTALTGAPQSHVQSAASETGKTENTGKKAQGGTKRTGKEKGNPTPKTPAPKGEAVINLFDNFITQDLGIPDQEQDRQYVSPLTSHGNMYLFLRLFGPLIKFVDEYGQFIVWNGNRWLRTDNGGRKVLSRLYIRFLNKLYSQAKSQKALYTKNGEAISPDDMLKWAKASSKVSSKKALFELLKDAPGTQISQSTLDTDPYLLGVTNGVLNIRTRTLKQNKPEDLITRYARAAYNPKSEVKEFLKFIYQVCLGRQDLVDFLQEVLGYALSGLTKEQVFFLLLGTGANGKSTLVETFFHMLGDYAKGMPSHAFIKSESRAIRNDLARLPGVRFAPCAEINTGKSLDESMVKRATGGDIMTARFIGKEFFDFHLIAKFFFSVNTLPRVVGADNGIFRRLVVIPFEGDFQENMDKEKPEKLKAEIDGILAWAVEGFQRWHKRGHLVLPDCVIEACKAYRAEMDTVQSFLDECCILDPKAETPLGVLYEAYQNWAKGAVVDPAKMHLFGTLMGQKGFKKKKSGPWRWLGVALKTAPTVAQPNIFGPATDS